MISVTKTTFPSLDTCVDSLREIWATGQLTNNGPLLLRLREAFKNFIGAQNLLLQVANGMLALQLVIKTLDLKKGVHPTPRSFGHGQLLLPACPDGVGLGKVSQFHRNPNFNKMGYVICCHPRG